MTNLGGFIKSWIVLAVLVISGLGGTYVLGQHNSAGSSRGLAGSQGSTGLQGEHGLQGEQGIQGIEGLTANDGAMGNQGVQGLVGSRGLKGSTGPQGPAGPGGSQPAREVFGTVTAIDDGNSVLLPFFHSQADVLFDLENPTNPIALEAGTYAIFGFVSGGNMTVGGQFAATWEQEAPTNPQIVSSAAATSVVPTPAVTLAVTFILNAGDGFALRVQNSDGGGDPITFEAILTAVRL